MQTEVLRNDKAIAQVQEAALKQLLLQARSLKKTDLPVVTLTLFVKTYSRIVTLWWQHLMNLVCQTSSWWLWIWNLRRSAETPPPWHAVCLCQREL